MEAVRAFPRESRKEAHIAPQQLIPSNSACRIGSARWGRLVQILKWLASLIGIDRAEPLLQKAPVDVPRQFDQRQVMSRIWSSRARKDRFAAVPMFLRPHGVSPNRVIRVPKGLPVGAAPNLVLHCCGQSAPSFTCNAGWIALADRIGQRSCCPSERPRTVTAVVSIGFNPATPAAAAERGKPASAPERRHAFERPPRLQQIAIRMGGAVRQPTKDNASRQGGFSLFGSA